MDDTSNEDISSSEASQNKNVQPCDVFLKTVSDFIDRQHVEEMMKAQQHMLSRFEKTNEMLLNFNVLSANRYQVSVQEFKKHTQLLVDMKKDLDSVFKRLRNLKISLSNQYPDAFSACSDVSDMLDEGSEGLSDAASNVKSYSTQVEPETPKTPKVLPDGSLDEEITFPIFTQT